ncbi:prephenate dehydrogenase [Gottfriedia luciferensis]|uniref:prephenate dehydrogenase n=1 Tax=Gottfriedia luciferensis TaxID=178774 RepID=UPI000B43B708|nr:prephenate dehydrogenase [Gottfriedia luciferensis]
MKKNVLLIGTGLIGGSIALAIKKVHDVNIIGYDINESQLEIGKRIQVLDEISVQLKDCAEKAHLIILSCPVEESIKYLHMLSEFNLLDDVVITDVGSTKSEIMKHSRILSSKGYCFIGGHPMAGSHKTGIESAKVHLFENAYYILTPSENTKDFQIDELKNWLSGTGSHFVVIDEATHDQITGVVSHFPHLIAASLVKQVKSYSKDEPLATALAAGGFRDITRIASSSPKMWTDIVMQNKDTLLSLIANWIDDMKEMYDLVEKQDNEEIYHYFKESKDFRDNMPTKAKGAIPSYFDLYVDVLDQVGELANITTILSIHHVSITNLRIIESREGLPGVLRISLQTEKDREKAEKFLNVNGYETYIVS